MIKLNELKKNFKIVARILAISGLWLVLLICFIKNENIKSLLFYVVMGIAFAGLLQLVLFVMQPKWFRNKS
jgi:hypothetical protein